MALSIMLLTTMVLSALLLLINFWLPQSSPEEQKLSPYECGFDPIGPAHIPLSIRFFLIAILFLLFDLEIALLLPLPWAMNLTTPQHQAIMAIALIVLLTLGLVYEWLQGGLEWAE
uniref:NADH-ubiquinone oxidoreductase chain 3 n=1 Tax=Bipes tridactylus TaxID=273520 RepID=Q66SR4_9SAUR|nr:NADH dehydrogenase subunit 3 [Bipes tridactylus]AAT08549.1 NADH dehydrogenase subunit 3 [Bipes tridactylus]